MTWTACRQNIEAEYAHLHPEVPAEDFRNNLLISPRYGYAFLNNPKVACTTIRKLLIDAERGAVRPFADRAPSLHYKEFLPFFNAWQIEGLASWLAASDHFTFCFVRNPFTRLLSGYLDKIVRGESQRMNILKALGREDEPTAAISFSTFVRTVCAMPVMEQDPHWRVQYYHTCQAGIAFDFVGRFENLEADLRIVARRLGIEAFITEETFGQGSRQHATGAGAQLREYYTSELVDCVREAFAPDFAAFGYANSLPD
ncbi:MAG: sulfotransferase family protein [Bacteroidota bacterium]